MVGLIEFFTVFSVVDFASNMPAVGKIMVGSFVSDVLLRQGPEGKSLVINYAGCGFSF